ncbi:binding-protein-dependent transport systems inner membrane component [Ferrimonas balearica DSM 9799]|uniref:Binding-protein-dependent transport systems inner membrane component n=1 Tax=Ferrimonas balearica (strain DSM 9799 / CCM 4581 / KCTC 23876 / PAT) TaxID=550540 RepID=E1SLM5_FERBD|nr:iron ABC transporter permease [Ferrimonas balearica]ADN77576.1 binding-protein-dependent transport systems inner membrane component [Ferrimonas balearica DSM 9799]MBW3141061.1 iron ABC transporter permease [Ferrimonas balearica]MBW3165739.1 iron ABC transporter permease [Ferrimonas balearica]MBY5981649.1 iron ABC transporter permease [Ferrimonas balearica]MBY6107915.1 iron ABC transporter permease [Ferrimonas balearica]
MILTLSRRWSVGGFLTAAALTLPLFALVLQSLQPDQDAFQHLTNTVLNAYVANTVSLILLVCLGSLLLGLPSAWLVAMCRFPGQRVFQWAMLLPLAMPAYIVAYVYTDLLDYAGPIQRLLRDVAGFQGPMDYYFPPVRSLGGAAIMLSLVLFPYVFMLARTAFLEQASNLIQASRTLGCTPWQSFWRLSLPLARPAIAVGLSLVAMETLADFATVSYFAVNTLTTGVYDIWQGHGSMSSAARLSTLMLLGIAVLMFGERMARRRQQQFQKAEGKSADYGYTLTGWRAVVATGYCTLLLFLSFILPALILLDYAVEYFDPDSLSQFWQYSANSLMVSALVAALTVVIALGLQFLARVSPRRWDRWPSRIAGFGYALPGTVLAIGILIPLTRADFAINDLAEAMGMGLPGLILSGSMVAIVFGYTVRFLAVALGSIESSFKRVSPSLDMAGATMGYGPAGVLRHIHLPLVRRGMLAAALIVFIEAMKELPAALLLKPIGFETLATYVYQFVSDEALELGALPALVIVLVGLLPVLYLNRSLEHVH